MVCMNVCYECAHQCCVSMRVFLSLGRGMDALHATLKYFGRCNRTQAEKKNKQQHISELLKVGSDKSAHKFCLPFTPQQIKQVLAGAEYNKGIL